MPKLRQWPHRSTLLALLGLLCSCSPIPSSGLYERQRQEELAACWRLPISQQDACRQQYEMTYAEYLRQRQELFLEEDKAVTTDD